MNCFHRCYGKPWQSGPAVSRPAILSYSEPSQESTCSFFISSSSNQRVEVFGSLGMAADENDGDTTVRVSTVDGVVSDKPQFFFLERYMGSFIAEMKQFIHAIQTNGEVPVGIHAGLMSVVLAKAAKKSLDEHRPVKIAEILEA